MDRGMRRGAVIPNAVYREYGSPMCGPEQGGVECRLKHQCRGKLRLY